MGQKFSAHGQVRLMYAKIGGALICVAGTFSNPPMNDNSASGLALLADGINVKDGVYLRASESKEVPFVAHGEVRFRRAIILKAILIAPAVSFLIRMKADTKKTAALHSLSSALR